MEAEVTELKYKSQFPVRDILFLKKINKKEVQPLCNSRSVFLFSEITGIQELEPQTKQTVGTEEKDSKGMEGTWGDTALKNSLQALSLSNFAQCFRILIISLLSFIFLTKKELRNWPITQSHEVNPFKR